MSDTIQNEDQLMDSGNHNEFRLSSPDRDRKGDSPTTEKSTSTKSITRQSDNFNDEDLEDDGPGLEEILRELEDLDSDSNDEDEPIQQSKSFKISRQERIRMLALRQFLNKLDEDVERYDVQAAQLREEVKNCHDRLKAFSDECNAVADEIAELEERNNKAAIYRLQSHYTKLCVELSSEQEVETSISEELKRAELDLAKAQLERSKYVLLNEELEQQELILKTRKAEIATIRAHKEEDYGKAAVRYLKMQQRMEIVKAREDAERVKRTANDALENRKRAQTFLQETLARMKKEELKKENESRMLIQKRMNSVQSLKKRIEATRENMRAIHARDMQKAYNDHLKEQKERQFIRERGGNPDVEILRKQQLKKFDGDKKNFEAEREQRQVAIIEKLVKEEENIKKRQKRQPYLFKPKPIKVKPDQTKKQLKIISRLADELYNEPHDDDHDVSIQTQSSDEDEMKDVIDDANQAISPEIIDDKEAFAIPEFQGMWSQSADKRDDSKLYGHYYNSEQADAEDESQLLDQEQLGEKYTKMIQKQIVSGREFKGKAFSSNPEVIVFKDFSVGKTYKQVVQLTNVSYSINSVKFLDVSKQLKDFIEIKFNPPGYMSAGLTCKMMVIFTPKINENLEGELKFLAQTGPFTVPLKIYKKKCALKTNVERLDFGQLCVGEKKTMHLTLINDGALDTEYEITRIIEVPKSASPPGTIGRITTVITEQDPNKGKLALDYKGEPKPTSTFQKSISFRSLSQQSIKKDDKNYEAVGRKESTSLSVTEKLNQQAGIEDSTDAQKMGNDDKSNASTVAPDALPDDKDRSSPLSNTAAVTSEKQVTIKDDTSLAEKELLNDNQPPDLISIEDDKKSLLLSDITDKGDSLSQIESRASTGTVLSTHTVSEDSDVLAIDKNSALQIGEKFKGHINSFSSVEIELNFAPLVTGRATSDFQIAFTDPESVPIVVTAVGTGIDVAVWVKRQVIDLKVCMVDRLYQDSVIIQNRATSALRLRFDVPKPMQEHLEILPRHGIVQAESSFSAQLKFLPRRDIRETCKKYVDPISGEMDIPITIKVADQTRPVIFNVKGEVTVSDIEFSVEGVDFGYCTIHESVISTITIENKSSLPQSFGFIDLNDYISVQPGDGFGMLLPFEKLEIDIIFSPQKAGEYSFELTCKTTVDRKFKLPCKAVGVLPPLQLSSNVINFAATAINDVSISTIFVENTHLDKNQFTHPVPRIGNGPIADVGSTSFEFVVPDDCPVTISPNVGTVEPGQRIVAEVRFSPRLQGADIEAECQRITIARQETKRKEEERRAADLLRQEMEENAHKKKKKGAYNKRPISPKAQLKSTASVPSNITAKVNKQANTADKNLQGESIYNTLYLEILGTVVSPALIVISNNGDNVIDYGTVSVGESETRSVIIQNISDTTLKLYSTILDTAGPFEMINAMRVLSPGNSHTVSISFTPKENKEFLEVMNIVSSLSKLAIRLHGKGVAPSIQLSIPNHILDFGNLLTGDAIAETFKITNTSMLPVTFNIKQDSIYERNKTVKPLANLAIEKKFDDNTPIVGPANYSGLCVFDCSPVQGTIKPGGSKEITVIFSPDHPSKYYSDLVRIILFDSVKTYHLRLIGKAWPLTLYALGGDRIEPTTESLSTSTNADVEEDQKLVKKAHPILLIFKSWYGKNGYVPVNREIEIGCVRTVLQSTKKIGEFWFDDLHSASAKGFSVDPTRGGLDPGARRTIVFTWAPPISHNPNIPVEFDLTMTLKDYGTETYKIMLRANINIKHVSNLGVTVTSMCY
ncbi:uncharacterized protein TRIADDRAFT_57490 [Trichoplax adhaerens]|uniref:Uncharacterized protein n=1 Tax=Trichoplax adhaerens TaxID=10228 RepID=B3RZK6_TRIAD|nr:hypothetical protein TRIADDRAFT_57490 [Trichoplax adhaerens]EDV24224.1 hypothetical protein TRIADDRAFT_57490 [Trichoplax adhaerens]|eukprot:XP_002113750.1 hypothetical protein TRIADDRAFT_57490 [Trichoplax adhaerens]